VQFDWLSSPAIVSRAQIQPAAQRSRMRHCSSPRASLDKCSFL